MQPALKLVYQMRCIYYISLIVNLLFYTVISSVQNIYLGQLHKICIVAKIFLGLKTKILV